MFIASKYEEMYAPEIGDFVYITDRAYTESQIREMEMRILDTFGFAEGKVVPAEAGEKELYVALTSDPGLFGAIHSSICKGIRNELLEKPNLDNVAIICVGDKSRAQLAR